MDFYSNFSWAVPFAFTDAIQQCRFGVGDILYSSPAGYDRWDIALKKLKFSIQVTFPERSVGGDIQSRNAKGLFYRNWFSPVKFTMTDYKNKKAKKYYDSIQGRLFDFLRYNDFKILENTTPAPQPPIFSSTYLRKTLKSSQALFEKLSLKKIKTPYVFVTPHISTNKISVDKIARLNAILGRNFETHTFEYSPSEIGIEECKVFPFFPAVTFKCFAIQSSDKDKINSAIKDAISGASFESKTKQFDPDRYGLLVSV